MPPLVLTGQRVVTLGSPSDHGAAQAAKIFINDEGVIEAITGSTGAEPTGYAHAAKIDVGNRWVMPGFIDLHTHVAYNTLPLWLKAGQTTAFAYHESWNRGDDYHEKVMWPYSLLAQTAPEALLAWVQTRALVGGTTSMQGWPTANRSYFRSVRNIDIEQAGHTQKVMEQSVATLDYDALTGRAQDERGDPHNGKVPRGFIYHMAEGQPAPVSSAANEFKDARKAGCLQSTFIGIHCTALAPEDWQTWPTKTGVVVWSPFSNLWLYGKTTDVGEVQKRGIPICLGSYWGPSGTKHVLGELKVAKLVVQDRMKKLTLTSPEFTDEELVRMVTTNPGGVLERCWGKPVGRLTAGAFADITVLSPNGGNSFWSDVIRATEREVELVIVNGERRYGTKTLMAGAALAADIDVAPHVERVVALADPADKTNKTPWSWKGVKDAIDEVRKNPAQALKKARNGHRAYGGPIDDIEAPLQLQIDLPEDVMFGFPDLPDNPDDVKIPDFQSLVHDDDGFLKAIKDNPIHNGVLGGLADYYKRV